MTGRIAARELLLRSDPLSEEGCISLIGYGEEDRFVDFKRSFDLHTEKSWIDLAIDCAAFANSEGGFIVFGVQDGSWKKVGIDRESANALRDTKKVIEKINRGDLQPRITRLGTRVFESEDMEFAVVHVPSSRDLTHIFESNLDWTAPGGKPVRGVSKGAIYVRQSASNQVLTSAGFEELVRRRIEIFREKILDGVVRAVNVSSQEEVVTVSRIVGVRGETDVKVVDAPVESGLSGKALTFTVESLADKIRLYMALVEPKRNVHIDSRLLFEAFARRHEQGLGAEEREWVALFSLLRHAPVFFWLKDLRNADSRRIIEAAFKAGTNVQKGFILNYAFFFGDSFYGRLRAQVSAGSARYLRNKVEVFGRGPSTSRTDDERRASELAMDRSKSENTAAEYELERLDCALYAPFAAGGRALPKGSSGE